MLIYRVGTAVLLLALFSSPSRICHAETIFLGPTPYLSKTDSPFPVDGSNPTFFLEDFEDGEFNTPGITQPSAASSRGIVVLPGQPLTNSVDADDGSVDGMGRDGRAWRSTLQGSLPISPPIYESHFSFGFDFAALGFLPTAFGFAWTHGPPNSAVRVTLNGANGPIDSRTYSGIGSGLDNDTSDDRFFGVISSEGIRGLLISTIYVGNPSFAEIDHIQYGVLVPEPPAVLLTVELGAGIAAFCIWRARTETESSEKNRC